MTPESIQTITQLRSEFYTLLSAALQRAVSITKGSASLGSPPIAIWLDDWQRLNYVLIYAHVAPDALVPKRPLILRLSINQGAGTIATKYQKSFKGVNQVWKFELTIMPDEILSSIPWIVELITSQARTSISPPIKNMPPIHQSCSRNANEDRLWTEKAWSMASLVVAR